MATEEVIEKLEDMYKSDNPFMYGRRAEIRAAISALKTATPKEAHAEKCKEYTRYSCPTCNKHFKTIYQDRVIGYIRKYCEECGQKIDRGEHNEENRSMSDVQ